ncbi:hypothetical protein ABTM38_19780, partial [Acinetobacter baumannii]
KVATKGDIEALARIEDEVKNLRAEFESAHAELVRIGEIERRLAEVSSQTSENALSTLIGRATGAEQNNRSTVEFHSVAIAAAEAA